MTGKGMSEHHGIWLPGPFQFCGTDLAIIDATVSVAFVYRMI